MSDQSYDYQKREGILPISWNEFHGICKGLASVTAGYKPEIILAIGRGGLYPGTLLAHVLQVEMYPIVLSRRVKDEVRYLHPRWVIQPPQRVKNKRVLIVDEIASTGETLRMVKEEAVNLGAKDTRCAVLYSHTRSAEYADYIGIISDALILNPWDREIWKNGKFQPHPEYVEAFRKQRINMIETDLLNSPVIKPVKA